MNSVTINLLGYYNV